MVYEKMRKMPIWNCGVQAGKMSAIKDLWLQIWLMCKAGGRLNPDQAAYNILMNSHAWKSVTKFTMSESGWSAQVGTTIDPEKIEGFKPHLLEAQPIWKNGLIHTTSGNPHTILHQWDRIKEWKNEIEAKYG
jgi:hypothetical protein